MKRMSKGRKKKKFRRRVFFSLLVIDILMVTIFGSIAYITYIEETQKRNDLAMDAAGERVRNTLENVMTGMREYYMGISDNNEIAWMLEQTEVPYRAYNEVISAQRVLQGNYSISEYVEEYTFVNETNGWILSNTGMYSIDEVENLQQLELFLDEQENEIASVYWYNNMEDESLNPTSPYDSKTISLGGMFLMEWVVGSGNNRGVLIVRLNMNKIRNLINEVREDYDVCLYSKGKKLMYSSSNMLYEDSLELMEHFEGRRDWKNAQSSQKDSTYRMNLYASTNDGIDCIIGYDINLVRESGEHLLIILMSFGGGLLVILLICFYLSGRISKPVNELVHSIQAVLGGSGAEVSDEFMFLENGVAELATNRENMQKLIRLQERTLMELFFEHMIRGELPQQEIVNNLQRFGVEQKQCYRLLAMVCLLEEGKGDFGDLEKEAVGMLVVRHMPEEIQEKLFLPPICYGEEILVLIGADEDCLSEQVLAVNRDITAYIQETYKVSMAVGGSRAFRKLKHMKTAYHEAIETLRNETTTLYFDGSAVAFYEDLADTTHASNVYDTVGENMLTEALDRCDEEQTFLLLDQFVDRIRKAQIIRHERSYYLNRLLVSMLAVPSNAGIIVNQIFREQAQDVFSLIRTTYDNEKLKQVLKNNVAKPIMIALAEFRHTNVSGIKEQVVQLIKESRGNVSLSECAQRLGYHPSYIWKVLKAEGNQTFTDLVNLEKLEMAKQMLLETEHSVAAIAETLGYSNTQNFIRFFSRYEGTTPGKFRKERRGR